MDFQENLGSYKFPYISGRIWSLKKSGLFNFQENRESLSCFPIKIREILIDKIVKKSNVSIHSATK